MRWKAYHFLHPTTETTKTSFGFKTTKTPPTINELKDFEDRMLDLIQNIEFRNATSDFQKKLSRDVKDIKKDNDLLIAADKTTNFYRVNSTAYKQLMNTAITKTYKKAPANSLDNTVAEEKKIAQQLGLDNKIDALAENQSFVTLKDHKPNFSTTQPAASLIRQNPKLVS